MSNYTLGDLKDMVLDRLEGNSLLYTAPELTAVINEVLRIVNIFTGYNQTSVQLTGFTVANQLNYDIPTGILFPTRIAYEGRDLDKVALSRIGQEYRTWATDTTDTFGPVARWIPIGLTKFAIHPIDAQGGGNLTITGVAETTQLVADGDEMQLDDEFVTLVVEYCAHRLPLKETGKAFADASVLIQTFWKEMKTLKRWQQFKAPRYFVQVQEPS